ncbi:MAG: nuclear transport factor 2 family protein [Anaerolineales bacterium]|nr:nuclear transport factor 2 family protein [Anaerolineales bacterium]
MEDANEAKILKYEERLRKAMLRSDVSALDQLLAPELIFTNHLGQV